MSPKRIVPLLVLTCLVGFLVWRYGIVPRRAGDGLLVSGTVEATEARLGFELPGRLVAVLPREGDRVEAGAPLARLDAAELEARHAQAAAQVAAARAQLAELEAGSRPEEIAAARAALAAAEERVADAERDVERARRLYDGRAIARE
ncbi:MAG: biotin/lipoyl-binding protein, partial [Acidobacteriota bacterium]|nr:biotin/lipoyl-binding protein [Acidobacteriota bacterium]